MTPNDYREVARGEARNQLSGLRIVKPTSVPYGFQYAYLARLIDDRELSLIVDSRVRSETRAIHRDVYRKSLRLLQRDVVKMLVNRRKLMAARNEWRFEALVSETARVWQLLWTLRIAGVAHALHVPLMVTATSDACAELGRLMTEPLTSVQAIRAA